MHHGAAIGRPSACPSWGEDSFSFQGTFYLRSSQGKDGQFWIAPFPFDPYRGALPIQVLDAANRIFLVEDSAADFLRYRISTARGIAFDGLSRIGIESSMDLNELGGEWLVEAPPPPPLFSMGQQLCLTPPSVIGSNAVSLVITNQDGSGWETNAYDLFFSTNLLELAAPQLCLTNWAWLGRSVPPAQSFSVSNLLSDQGWFRLGTMLDSDQDGATDAYERLTSHTDPGDYYSAPDSNGNGVPDRLETAMGFDPTQANGLGQNQPGYSIFVAQP